MASQGLTYPVGSGLSSDLAALFRSNFHPRTMLLLAKGFVPEKSIGDESDTGKHLLHVANM